MLIRRMRGSLSDYDAGYPAILFIQENILPKLRRTLKFAVAEEEKFRLQGLISDYERCCVSSDNRYETLGKIVNDAIRKQLAREGNESIELDDLEQEIQRWFYGEKAQEILKRFDSKRDDVRKFIMFWNQVVFFAVKTKIEEFHRKENNENKGRSSINPNRLMSENPYDVVEKEALRKIYHELIPYVRSKIKKEDIQIFESWFEWVLERGGRSFDLKRLWKEKFQDKMSFSYFQERLERVRVVVRKYLADLLGVSTETAKKYVGMSIIDRVAEKEYLRRFAVWILG